jgi:signal transduction histidine kinase
MARLRSIRHVLVPSWRRLAGPRPGVLLVSALFVFGLVAACAYAFVRSEAASRRDAERSFAVQARITAELTSSLLGSAVSSSQAQAAAQLGAAKPTASDLAKAARRAHLSFVLVLDARGRVLAASPGTPTGVRRRAASGPDDVQHALGGQAWLSGLIGPKSSGHQLIEWAVPYRTVFGPRVALEGLDVRLLSTFLGDYLRTPGESEARVGYIVDAQNRVIAASTGVSVVSGSLLRSLGGRASAGRFHDSREEYFVTSSVTGSDWRVLLAEPTSVLYPALAGTQSWVLSAALAVFAAVALLMLALLRRMLADTNRIRLANAQLGELNVTLEARVAERTAVAEERASELARSNDELEQFASVASHDLQEPLRKIRMYCGRLPKRLGDDMPEEAATELDRIQNAAERMQQLIDDLLSFARVTRRRREFEPVDLGTLAREVRGDLEARIVEAGARVEIGSMPVVLADRVQMGQLLQNLISNALKFHRPGVAPIVRIRAELVDQRYVVSVVDNGIGFEPRYAERIFSAFERLHGRSEYEGTGIGLSIARKIARRHGGELTAAGRPGGGATFTLTLPVSEAQPREVAA